MKCRRVLGNSLFLFWPYRKGITKDPFVYKKCFRKKMKYHVYDLYCSPDQPYSFMSFEPIKSDRFESRKRRRAYNIKRALFPLV